MKYFSKLTSWTRKHQKGLFWCACGLIVLSIIFNSKWLMVCILLLALMLVGASVDDYADYGDEL